MTATPARSRGPTRAFLTTPVSRRTWAELAYALLGLPLGVIGFAYVVATLYAGALTVILVGLPLTAAAGLGARWLGTRIRLLANRMLGANVPAPARFRPKPGLVGWTRSGLGDGTAWRARAYLVLKLPVGIAGFAAAAAFLGYGLGGLTYPAWRPFLPCDTSNGGLCHRGAGLGNDVFLDTWWRIVLTAAGGLVCLLLIPWLVHGLLAVDRVLVRTVDGRLAVASPDGGPTVVTVDLPMRS